MSDLPTTEHSSLSCTGLHPDRVWRGMSVLWFSTQLAGKTLHRGLAPPLPVSSRGSLSAPAWLVRAPRHRAAGFVVCPRTARGPSDGPESTSQAICCYRWRWLSWWRWCSGGSKSASRSFSLSHFSIILNWISLDCRFQQSKTYEEMIWGSKNTALHFFTFLTYFFRLNDSAMPWKKKIPTH